MASLLTFVFFYYEILVAQWKKTMFRMEPLDGTVPFGYLQTKRRSREISQEKTGCEKPSYFECLTCLFMGNLVFSKMDEHTADVGSIFTDLMHDSKGWRDHYFLKALVSSFITFK